MGRPTIRPNSRFNHLPEQFPVGATYVVEGRGGADGNFRAMARYVLLPSGQRINLPAEAHRPAAPAATRVLPFRNRTDTKQSQANGRHRGGRKKIVSGHGTT
jgi:hypothetical protein